MTITTAIFATVKRFIRYAFRPDFEKSMAPLATTYFHFGRMLAGVFGALGIIERTHPWMGIIQRVRPLEVLSLACSKVNWKKPFSANTFMTGAIVLLVGCTFISLLSLTLGATLSAGQAYAQSMFAPANPSTDLALKYMAKSFGITISGVNGGAMDGVVEGFQKVMGIYSMAMLIVAGFILMYIVLSVIASTAHEGRFGGSGFNQVWAPLRLVVAIGLLVPLPINGYSGYNSGQYIIMKIAEWGSGLATNIWVPFATSLAARGDVVATPSVPAAASAVRGVLINEFCGSRYNQLKALYNLDDAGTPPITIQTQKNQGSGSVIIKYTQLSDVNGEFCGTTTYTATNSLINPMAQNISAGYINAYNTMRQKAAIVADQLSQEQYFELSGDVPGLGREEQIKKFVATSFITLVENYQNDLKTNIEATVGSQNAAATDAMTAEVQNAGWAGASVWFNTIARINAEIMAAARGIPSSTLPTYKTSTAQQYTLPFIPKVQYATDKLRQYINATPQVAQANGFASNYGATSSNGVSTKAVMAGMDQASFENADIGTLAKLGLGSIFSMIATSAVGGPFGEIGVGTEATLSEIYPLAQLANIGNYLLNLAYTTAGLAMFAPVGLAVILISIASLTLSAGMMLFYVTPLMPFIRLTFAVMGWLLNILEAVIALPLVALAHLTSKGDGISGDLARKAYFMVLSIFLRPPLLMVGMICAMMMFSVSIGILNDLYKAAVVGYMGNQANVGFTNILVYTIMYTVIAVGLCNLCFKLIEEIPNRSMEWIGQASAREITQDEGVARALTKVGGEFVGVGGRLQGAFKPQGMLLKK